MAPKADSKCSIAAKKKFNETMIAMGKAAGKAACTEAFEIWNTFIHTIAAFINPFGWSNRKAGRIFCMKGAKPLVVCSLLGQGHIFTDNLGNA